MIGGRYRIVSLLGQGGMGAVYRAWDTRLNVPVALKEMVPQPGIGSETLTLLRQQFEREANVLARLSHPHLVDVIDFFEEGDNVYLAMKFVEGESLADRIVREGQLAEAQVLAWAGQLLDALAYCHAQGVIHRDIKPQNIVVTPRGEAVLVDFGLVKLWDPNDPQTKTAMRGMGTPQYAPPEQYDVAAGHTDARSDVYGLGATLYHALTGQPPPTATTRIVDPDALVPVRTLAARVSEATETAVMRALELRPPARFQIAEEMADALEGQTASLTGSVVAGRGRTKAMAGAQAIARRHLPVWVWGVGGVAVLLVVVGVAGGVSVSWLFPFATPTTSTATGASTARPPLFSTTAPTAPSVETDAPTYVSTSTPLPTSSPTPVIVDGMAYVSAGEFDMGNEEWRQDEMPVHTVYLDAFYIDQTEVTWAEYATCVEAGGCTPPRETGLFEQYGASGYEAYPAARISWYQAQTYCIWVGKRLPTEAEWEKAACGTDERTYPWGEGRPTCDMANFSGCAEGTMVVGGLSDGASPYGVLGMGGNVAEWVADWYGPYTADRQENPTGPSSGEHRAVRGGSYQDGTEALRCTARASGAPTEQHGYWGFRCVRDAD
jgi:formylglycine-generating enzyme required for sulfatase activity